MNSLPSDPGTGREEPLLEVRELTKFFPIKSRGLFTRKVGVIKAVDAVSFSVERGETLGLVGESGSGKTTCARAILRVFKPTSGQVLFRDGGRVQDLATLPERELVPLRTRLQMIFQDPFSSLNPRMTIEEILGEPLLIHGLARGNTLRERVREALLRVGLSSDHLARFPHEFSGGQRQRIGIARALITKPALVIADEPVSALDVSVQAQVINLLKDLQQELGLTCIFVAHDLSVVRHVSHRVAVMYAGRIVEIARTSELFEAPQHPYTRALLSSVPSADPDVPVAFAAKGEVADLANLPRGCSFAPRCPERVAICEEERPRLLPILDGTAVACHLRHAGRATAPST